MEDFRLECTPLTGLALTPRVSKKVIAIDSRCMMVDKVIYSMAKVDFLVTSTDVEETTQVIFPGMSAASEHSTKCTRNERPQVFSAGIYWSNARIACGQ